MTTPKDKDIESAKKLLEPGVVRFSWKAHVDEIAQALAAAREEGRDAEWKRVLADLKRCENEAEKVALKHREAGRESAYQRFAGHADFCSFGHIHLAPLEERQKLADNLNKMREGNLPTNAPEGESDEC